MNGRPHIVITDAATVSRGAGDLDLSVFEQYGSVTAYPLTSRAETAERISDADCVLLNKTVLDAEVLKHAPHLRYIGIFATGYNMIDLDYCRAHGITVSNAGSYSTDAVAQTVFSYLLHFASRTADYNAFVSDGGWKNSPSFSPFVFPTFELAGKTLGIFGYGAIGKRVAALARAFSMRVLAVAHTPKTGCDEETGAVFTDLDTMLKVSDFVTVHTPLTAETKELFSRDVFAKMKPGAYFINTSRGGVIVESDLRRALESGHLAGAAVDVLTVEPMAHDCVLFGTPNLIMTPHIAWAPTETRQRLVGIVTENLRNFLVGKPTHVVS
ncbi:MAG: D-2-hydroxyacid dehydrogenase [Clostridia bacterium]|nr:D-2-hydroxyacid dehydrogenase [Clostridia bacterium]